MCDEIKKNLSCNEKYQKDCQRFNFKTIVKFSF